MFVLRAAALAVVVLAAVCGAAPAAEVKNLTIIVGSSAGGGYDTYARLLARHIGRHLAEQPTLVVQNMPGSSSLKAVQHLDGNSPKDGTVMTAFNPGLITESLLNPDKIRFKFSDVAWIGSITRDLRACYAWGTTGIKSFDDLKRTREFNIGAPAPGTSSFINAAVLKNLFGVAVHHVLGYAGSSEQRLAIERGELDGDCGAWSSLPPEWITGKRVNPLLSFSPVPIPGMVSEVPFVVDLAASQADKDLLKLLIAPDALGRPFVVSRQVPPNALAALRTAFDQTMQDPQFLAEAKKMDLPVAGPIGGLDAAKIIDEIYAASPTLVARAQQVVSR